MTFFLPIEIKEDGTLTTFLRNPERNVGRFMDLQHIELLEGKVKLLGMDNATVAELNPFTQMLGPERPRVS